MDFSLLMLSLEERMAHSLDFSSSKSNKSNSDNGWLVLESLRKLQIDKHSWQGHQKKQIYLKLKECSAFLKEWNISDVDHILVPYIKQFLNKIDSLEEEANLKYKTSQIIYVKDEIEELNEVLKRNIDHNVKFLEGIKTSSVRSDEHLDSFDEHQFPIMEIPPLSFERINQLLDVIEGQEKELLSLQKKKKELSPK